MMRLVKIVKGGLSNRSGLSQTTEKEEKTDEILHFFTHKYIHYLLSIVHVYYTLSYHHVDRQQIHTISPSDKKMTPK